jgi:SET domain-containing protein
MSLNDKFTNNKNRELAELGNSVGGPQIKMSNIKGVGYGLFADKNYKKKDLVTSYGGSLHYKKIHGDYAFRLSEDPLIYVDGECDFHPSEKGRWLNHGSEDQKDLLGGAIDPRKPKANTEFYIGNKNRMPICYIRALTNILKGEELYVDYGPLYW